MATGAIIARILTQYSDKGSKAASKDIAKLGKTFDNFGRNAARAFGVASAASAAFAIKFAKDSVKAAVIAQGEQNRLRQILLTTNGATEEQIVALNQQAEALERVGVVSGGNVTIVQSQLATFDLLGKTIYTLTPAILDYVTAEKGATATSDQFKTATNGLAQALNGNFAALTRTGFVLDDATKKMISNGTESQRAAAIVKVLESTYKGFNAELRKTPEGQMVALGNAFTAIKTELGMALLPTVEKFTKLLQNDVLPRLQEWIKLNQDKLVKSFQAAAAVAYQFLLVVLEIGNWVSNNMGAVKVMAALIAGMFAINAGAKFILMLQGISAGFVALRTAAASAAVAVALATGGVSVGAAVTALAAVGATALVTKNLYDMVTGKNGGTSTNKSTKTALDNIEQRGINASSKAKNPFANALDKNTAATNKNTKALTPMDIATQNAIKFNQERQAKLSGSKNLAIGGLGSSAYIPGVSMGGSSIGSTPMAEPTAVQTSLQARIDQLATLRSKIQKKINAQAPSIAAGGSVGTTSKTGTNNITLNVQGSVISNEDLLTNVRNGLQRTTKRQFGLPPIRDYAFGR